MDRLGELFGKWQSEEDLSARERDALFGELQRALEPCARRLTWDSNDRSRDPWDRTVPGLEESLQSLWHNFYIEKFLVDPVQFQEAPVQSVVAYVATSFTRYVNGMRRMHPAAGAVAAGRFPMSRDGGNAEVVQDGLVDFANSRSVELPGGSDAAGNDEAQQPGRHQIGADDPDFALAVHWDKDFDALTPTETKELAIGYLNLARRFLEAKKSWVTTTIALLMAPQMLDDQEPMQLVVAAGKVGLKITAFSNRCRKLGLSTLNKDGSIRFHSGRRDQGSLLADWLTDSCRITDPLADHERTLLALEQLCVCARGRYQSKT